MRTPRAAKTTWRIMLEVISLYHSNDANIRAKDSLRDFIGTHTRMCKE